MAYQSSVWLGSVAALCPSNDTVGNGTTTLTDFTSVSNGVLTLMDPATDWVTDDGKLCLDFDGSNDYVITAGTPIGGAKCLALSVWFRRLATTGHGLCLGIDRALATVGVGRIAVYHYSDGNLYIQFDGLNYGYFALSLTDLGWHSLVIHFDGSQTTDATKLNVWLDGTAKTLTFNGTIPAVLNTVSDSKLLLGSIIGVYGRSRIDDVRINVRTFSNAERVEIGAIRGGTYAAATSGKPQHSMSQQVIG